MPLKPLRLTRPQLQAFLGNDFEAIRQFEKLFRDSDNFDEDVQDVVANMIQDGTGLTWVYDDNAGTLTGTVSLAPFSTSDLAEGSNLYYTDARVQVVIDADTTLLKVDGSRDATGSQQFENIVLTGFEQSSVQNVSSTDTVTSGVVFCTGDSYTLTMPSGVAGRKVEVFNTAESGYITVSQVENVDFDLYYGESLDMTYSGSEWRA